MNYKTRQETDAVVRLSDNKIIGPEQEQEWAEYQAWLAEGNLPEPFVPEEPFKEPTVQEKLARAGLTIDELKQALGL